MAHPRPRRVKVNPAAVPLFDSPAEVERLIAALGSNGLADVLGVSRSQPSRWKNGAEKISPPNRQVVADLHYVLDRLFQVLWPEQAEAWLESPNPHLNGARPIDVIVLRGAGPVIDAIDALAGGSYA